MQLKVSLECCQSVSLQRHVERCHVSANITLGCNEHCCTVGCAHLGRQLRIAAARDKDPTASAERLDDRPQLSPLAVPLEGRGATRPKEPVPELLGSEVILRIWQQGCGRHAKRCVRRRSARAS